MNTVDLSHTISSDMPVYPGTAPPAFIQPCTIEKDGFLENRITFFSHTGTHVDAPAHIIEGARTLDRFAVDHFIGAAGLIDLTGLKKSVIDLDDIKPHRDLIEHSEFILIQSGWSRHWGIEAYFHDYPVCSVEAALWLSGFSLKGIGLDMISADETGSSDFPVHRIFLKQEILLIENLTNLSALQGSEFIFACFPLKSAQADGSPVRAVAMIQKKQC